MLLRRSFLKLSFGIAAFLCVSALPSLQTARTAESLPARLTDDAFLRTVSDLSEQGGYFRYENFLSNELGFQHVIPILKETTQTGGVYIGVGPEQNFTYISALQPRIAFIIDIRRENMLEHLLHKAVIEDSSNRAEYISRLFSLKRPPGAGSSSTAEELFEAYGHVSPDRKLFEENLKAIEDRLVRHHGFK